MEATKAGRPTEYNQEIADKICLRLSEGESIRTIVRDEGYPSSSTIYRWLLDESKKPFWEQYEKARNIQAEQLFEQILEIADDGTNDYTTKQNVNGESYTVVNAEYVQRSRLRVDSRKWFLSKVLPKKFGDKVDMTSDGKVFPTPLLHVLNNNSDKENSQSQEEN